MVEDVTVTSWFSRLKDALVGIFVGFALLIAAIILLFWNERNSIHTLQSLEQTQKILIAVPNSPISQQNDLKVVYFNGMATTQDTLEDSELGVSLKAINLDRKVEMYQWQEHKETKKESQVGGSEKKTTTYTYEMVWSNKLIDSSKFKDPQEHQNPNTMPIASEKQYAEDVKVGDFVLPDSLIKEINESKPVKLSEKNADTLKETLDNEVSVVGDALYLGKNSQIPEAGDLRITMSAVHPQNVSIIGQQTGNTLQAYLAPAGEPILLLSSGVMSSDLMIHDAISDTEINTWLFRLASLVLLIVGFYLLMNPIVILADILPFLGSIAGFGAGFFAFLAGLSVWISLTAIAWFTSRPLFSTVAVAVIVILTYIMLQLKSKNKD